MAGTGTYEVRDEQSGRLFFSSSTATARADCIAYATANAALYRDRQFTVLPAGISVTSSRPLQAGPPAAGQLPIIEAYA
ncbi:MAG: hypothetical protein ACRENC_06705 [Gemmatimonadaceae bacterium]